MTSDAEWPPPPRPPGRFDFAVGSPPGGIPAGPGAPGPSMARVMGSFCLFVVGLAVAIGASLAFGARSMDLATVIDAIVAYDTTEADHLIVRELRWPRTQLGLLVGAALAVAGALTQAATRNPVAGPGLVGTNAGAALAAASAVVVLDLDAPGDLVVFGVVGAAVAAAVYAFVARAPGPKPVLRLVLAGLALVLALVVSTRAVTQADEETLDRWFWVMGSLPGREEALVPVVVLPVLLALLAAWVLSLLPGALAPGVAGADGAEGGPSGVGLAALAMVAVLVGCAVAAAGPIALIGLVAPIAARSAVGADLRLLVPASALLGPSVLMLLDVVGRLIIRPSEVKVGVMAAVIGVPIFALLVLLAGRFQAPPSERPPPTGAAI
ncbi:MAG: iron chelate uptake ABC transporter family permease subunit [Actinomycetota bacterium]